LESVTDHSLDPVQRQVVVGSLVTPYVGSTPGTPVMFNLPNSLEVVRGLANTTTYTFTVSAVTQAGAGAPSSPSNAVTPLASLRQAGAQSPQASPGSRGASQQSPALSPPPPRTATLPRAGTSSGVQATNYPYLFVLRSPAQSCFA
jgi:hypothetical protein